MINNVNSAYLNSFYMSELKTEPNVEMAQNKSPLFSDADRIELSQEALNSTEELKPRIMTTTPPDPDGG